MCPFALARPTRTCTLSAGAGTQPSAKTGLLVVPSRDWIEIDPVHSRMAAFRAVENGTSVVRQVDEGLSIVVDPYGRVLAQVDFFGATDRTMVAQVPTRHVTTLYPVLGPWLEWLAPIGLLVLAAWAWRRRRSLQGRRR
jgi:apolipoprotein N-acyltransferase